MNEIQNQAAEEIKQSFSYIEQAYELALEHAQRIGEILCRSRSGGRVFLGNR